jgi:hypothetical protein
MGSLCAKTPSKNSPAWAPLSPLLLTGKVTGPKSDTLKLTGRLTFLSTEKFKQTARLTFLCDDKLKLTARLRI